MSVEREGYRDNLARLNEFFPNVEILNVQDLVKFSGRDRRTVKKLFTINSSGYISKVEVARQLAN